MCSNAATLINDSRQNQNNYYTAFNFVDDYILDGNIDRDKMLESIKYYLNINYEELEQDDPYNKIKIYWELDDEEIRSSLLEILDNLKKNKYNYQLFPKIIYSISCIENLKFETKTIKEIIDEMGKYIEENKIEYIDFHAFARDEKVLEIYNKNISIIKEKMKTSKQSENEKSIKEIFKSNNWGVELLEYVTNHGKEYLDKRQFLNEFCISEIVKKIEKSNSKNIYYFKYCIDSIYNFSNLKEYYSIDLKNLEELIEGIDNIDKEKFGVTKKEAIEYLSRILKEIKKILE